MEEMTEPKATVLPRAEYCRMFQSSAKKGMAWLLCLIWSGPSLPSDDAVTSVVDQEIWRFDNERSAVYAKQCAANSKKQCLTPCTRLCLADAGVNKRSNKNKRPSFSLPEKVERSLDLLDLI